MVADPERHAERERPGLVDRVVVDPHRPRTTHRDEVPDLPAPLELTLLVGDVGLGQAHLAV
jgi:hypothetical protein